MTTEHFENQGIPEAHWISNPISPLLLRIRKAADYLGVYPAAQSIQVSTSQEDTHNF
jgi:hypothetical protein